MYFHKIKKLYSSVYIDFLLILLKIKIFVYWSGIPFKCVKKK